MSRTYHHSKRYWRGLKSRLWDEGGWLDREPRQWRKLYKHRRRRLEVRRGEREALCDPEGVVFPLDRRPHLGYW